MDAENEVLPLQVEFDDNLIVVTFMDPQKRKSGVVDEITTLRISPDAEPFAVAAGELVEAAQHLIDLALQQQASPSLHPRRARP